MLKQGKQNASVNNTTHAIQNRWQTDKPGKLHCEEELIDVMISKWKRREMKSNGSETNSHAFNFPRDANVHCFGSTPIPITRQIIILR